MGAAFIMFGRTVCSGQFVPVGKSVPNPAKYSPRTNVALPFAGILVLVRETSQKDPRHVKTRRLTVSSWN